MRLLLDSHIFLWYADSEARLGQMAIATIETAEVAMLSVASIWELNVKSAKGKLPLQRSLAELAKASEIPILNINEHHADAIMQLPRHHRDPFDHMLLAQAKVEELTLLTHDKTLAKYGVPILLI